MTINFQGHGVTLHHGDALDVLRSLPDASVHAVVTDPPYGLEFMGKQWDSFSDGTASSRAVAGMSGTGYTDGAERLERPSFMGGTNPKCRTCDRWQRGGNPCRCDAPNFPNERRARSAAFGEWCELWAVECLRVLKPGGHLLAFGGTRTWHRLACAVEDAGFEIRDSIAWLYGSGFPKSLNVAKAIASGTGRPEDIRRLSMGDDYAPSGRGRVNYDHGGGSAMNGATTVVDLPDAARQWEGWGTALKPAHEPVVVARKPLIGTVAANVTTHGTGALNIDGCRIGMSDADRESTTRSGDYGESIAADGWGNIGKVMRAPLSPGGRWPANVVLDEDMADVLDEQSGNVKGAVSNGRRARNGAMFDPGEQEQAPGYGDSGGASRFFYVAKAPKRERPVVDGVAHPTVKPLALMRWLVRLVTPPGGTVLEPFAGSGTTVEACLLEGFQCIAIEKGDEYLPLILARIDRQTNPLPEVAELVRRTDPEAAIVEQLRDVPLFELDGEGA